jgi:hypothetical protein
MGKQLLILSLLHLVARWNLLLMFFIKLRMSSCWLNRRWESIWFKLLTLNLVPLNSVVMIKVNFWIVMLICLHDNINLWRLLFTEQHIGATSCLAYYLIRMLRIWSCLNKLSITHWFATIYWILYWNLGNKIKVTSFSTSFWDVRITMISVKLRTFIVSIIVHTIFVIN